MAKRNRTNVETIDATLIDSALDSVRGCERAIRASAEGGRVLRLRATRRGIDRLDGLRTLVSYEPDGTTIYVGVYQGNPWTIITTLAECNGHPAGPYDPMGKTVYCDGTCNRTA